MTHSTEVCLPVAVALIMPAQLYSILEGFLTDVTDGWSVGYVHSLDMLGQVVLLIEGFITMITLVLTQV